MIIKIVSRIEVSVVWRTFSKIQDKVGFEKKFVYPYSILNPSFKNKANSSKAFFASGIIPAKLK